jgi:hypothetical protein
MVEKLPGEPMTDSKGKDKPSDRELSQQQARENAEDARASRKSGQAGVDDDSSVMQSMVAALGAPVEGAIDSLREREKFANQGRDLGPDQVGGISGQRAEDIPNLDTQEKRSKLPSRPEDAEAEPTNVAEDHAPGGRPR